MAAASASAAGGKPFVSRKVERAIAAIEQAEGVGARVRRSIGNGQLRNYDPFLMLDHFNVALPAGFPSHPHRGICTITYLLSGGLSHEDFHGHAATLRPGDLQVMEANRGIVHSEVPTEDGPAVGLQLWVNVPAKDKLSEPKYQEFKADEMASASADGVTVRIIAGKALGAESPVKTSTPISYYHFTMEPGSQLQQPIPADHNAIIYTMAGKGTIGGTACGAYHTMTLARDDAAAGIDVKADAGEALDFILVSGRPVEEPIFQHGPMVMDTQEGIRQAFYDYQNAANGFEGAAGWRASIDKRMRR